MEDENLNAVAEEFRRADAQVARAVECFHLAVVPAWPTEQEWGNTAVAQAHEQGRLYRSLGDFLIHELERL